MRITSVEFQPLNLVLQAPLKVAYGTYAELEYALIKVFTDEGLLGLGEASPDPEVTGETQVTVLSALKKASEFLIGKNPFDIAAIINECFREIPSYPAAIAAIDMALYDLIGQKLQIPVYQLLGGKDCQDIGLYPVIPMDEPSKMAGMSRTFADMGIDTLKIKLGSDPKMDLHRLSAIHDSVSNRVKLRLDINQGWKDAETSLQTIRKLKGYNIEWIEQPVTAGNLNELAKVTAASDIPIMADESCHNPIDALKIACHNAANIINIKLMKCGGITQAIKIMAVAEAAGLPCILGSMGESSIGSAAGLHLAIAKPGFIACELIGPLFINNDPAYGYQIDFSTFRTTPSETPGLGVKLK